MKKKATSSDAPVFSMGKLLAQQKSKAVSVTPKPAPSSTAKVTQPPMQVPFTKPSAKTKTSIPLKTAVKRPPSSAAQPMQASSILQNLQKKWEAQDSAQFNVPDPTTSTSATQQKKFPNGTPTSSTISKDLYDACKMGDLNKVQRLIEAEHANPHTATVIRDSSRVSATDHCLIAALRSQKYDLVQYLLQDCEVEAHEAVQAEIQDGRHHLKKTKIDALCIAMQMYEQTQNLQLKGILVTMMEQVKAKNMINSLLLHDVRTSDDNTNTRLNYGMSYLHYAAMNTLAKSCELLLQHGANPYLRIRTERHPIATEPGKGKTSLQLFAKLKDIMKIMGKLELLGSAMRSTTKFFNVTVIILCTR